jgi:hypothetical protein
MINNTRGTGEILGSRMLKIQTRKIPEGLRQEFGDLLPAESVKLARLRDDLHSWTFDNVRRIEAAYRSLYPKTPDRSDEITAPLKVMASLAGDSELHSRLEVALTRQGRRALRLDSPRELLRETLRDLVAQGYDTVSPTHLTLEVRRLISQSGDAAAEDFPEWARPEWIGRMLRSLDLVEVGPEGPARIRLHGANLRFYPLRAAYLREVEEWFGQKSTEIAVGTRRPTEFCGDCGSCPYNSLGCEIMPKRQAGGRLRN